MRAYRAVPSCAQVIREGSGEEDLIAFARRDWKSLAAMKDRFWMEQKQRMTASEVLHLGDTTRLLDRIEGCFSITS